MIGVFELHLRMLAAWMSPSRIIILFVSMLISSGLAHWQESSTGHKLHSSRRNKTVDSFRMALVNHYMRAESMLPWDQDGKPPLTEDLRDIVIVAGKDPYAWRKIVDVNKPSLRPDTPRAKERTRQYDE